MKCNEKDLFYNMDDATSDFNYWCKFTWLTIDQLTALSFRKNPDIVNLNSIRQLIKLEINTEFTHAYLMRYRLIEQAPLGLGLNGKLELSQFVDWALQHKLSIPEEMKSIVDNQSDTNIDNVDLESTVQLEKSPYWNKLANLCNAALEKYPAWKKQNKKIQKTGNLHNWLTETMQADTREVEIIKKVLSDLDNN